MTQKTCGSVTYSGRWGLFWTIFWKAAGLRQDLSASLLMSRWYHVQDPVRLNNICQWSQIQLAWKTCVLRQRVSCLTLDCIRVQIPWFCRSKNLGNWLWEAWSEQQDNADHLEPEKKHISVVRFDDVLLLFKLSSCTHLLIFHKLGSAVPVDIKRHS